MDSMLHHKSNGTSRSNWPWTSTSSQLLSRMNVLSFGPCFLVGVFRVFGCWDSNRGIGSQMSHTQSGWNLMPTFYAQELAVYEIKKEVMDPNFSITKLAPCYCLFVEHYL